MCYILCFAEKERDAEKKNYEINTNIICQENNKSNDNILDILLTKDSVLAKRRQIHHDSIMQGEKKKELLYDGLSVFPSPYNKRNVYLDPEKKIRDDMRRNFHKGNPRPKLELLGRILLAISAIFSFFGKKIITHIKTARNAIVIRSGIFAIRIVFFSIFCIILIGILYFLISSLWVLAIASFFAVLLSIGFWGDKGGFGNISIFTKQMFLKKHAKYLLYLRGFGDDIPNNDIGLNLEGKKNDEEMFNENEFFEKIEQNICICTVGRPQELDAPHGAKRIYLDDATWKNDVLELIEKATYIIVKVNDRDSCVWEILQVKEYLKKTVFIVDDKKIYQNVINKLALYNFLPHNLAHEYCYFYMSPESEEWIITQSESRQFSQLSNEIHKIFQ